MFLDQGTNAVFNSYTTPVAVTVTGDSSIIDLTGAGVGVAPAMTNGTGNSIGVDLGAGDGAALPSVNVVVGTTFTGTGNTTLTISLKAAPQTSATDYSQGTYTTLASTQAFAVPPVSSSLTAGTVINLPIPPLAPGQAMPRYYKLTYTVANGPLTAGKVSAGFAVSQPNLNGTYGSEAGKVSNNFTTEP